VTRLVLLPGLDGTGELFAPFVAALGAVPFQVMAYPHDRVMVYAELEAHTAAKLPTNEDFVLLAESFSGPIGISLAASRPPGIKGLILCASFAANPLPLFGSLGGVIGALPAVRIPARLAEPWLYAGRATAELREAHASAISRVSAKVINARVAAVLGVDYLARLAKVAVPILYLHGLADRLIPASAGQAILDCRPDVDLVEIDGPHFLLQCEPAACADAVKKFMERCAS
jgi:pimeloyl-[acyl-carrier protein] methyl ester esterase